MITVAQTFQIGTVLITFTSAIAGLYLDAQTTAFVGASVLTAWNAIGAILTGQSAQAASVAAHIDDAAVKKVVVPAVANLPGVEQIRTNQLADAILKAMADSHTPDLEKIVPPK